MVTAELNWRSKGHLHAILLSVFLGILLSGVHTACGQMTTGQVGNPPLAVKDTATISGRVIRKDGKPVGVIPVRAQIVGNYVQNGSGRTLTTAGGAYSIGGLVPGQYAVAVDTPPQDSSKPTDWAPPAPLFVEATAGTTTRAPDLVLGIPATVTGQVVDAATGQPVQGVTVGLQDPPSDLPPMRSVDVVTDQQGKFRASVWAGTLSIFVYNVPAAYVSNPNMNLPTLTVAEGQTVVIPNITLQHGLTITGVVVDDSGKPLPDISLLTGGAPNQDMTNVILSIPEVTSDQNGAFTISQLISGSYYLDPGPNWVVVSPTVFSVPATAPISLIIKKADVRDLTGTVIDTTGAPIPDVALTYTVFHLLPLGNMAGSDVSISTGSDGKFTLTGVPINPQMIQQSTVVKDGYSFVSGGSITQTGDHLTINPIVMAPLNGVITGRVLNGLNRPVAGAWVACPTGAPDNVPVQTDQSGNFRLSGLIIGTRDVFAAKGRYFAHVTVTVTALPSNTTVTLAPMPEPPPPRDMKDAMQMLTKQIADAKNSTTQQQDWYMRDQCAAVLSEVNPQIGLAFIGNYAAVNTGDLNWIIPPQEAIDPVSTVKWAMPLLERTEDNGYEGSIAAELGLTIAPYDLDSAKTLYQIAVKKISVNHLDNQNLDDVEHLTALAYATGQPEADDLFQKVLAAVNADVAAAKANPANGDAGWQLCKLAETMASGKSSLGLQLLSSVPDAYQPTAVTQIVKDLLPARPADALKVVHAIDNKSGNSVYAYDQCFAYLIPVLVKSDPQGAVAQAKAMLDPQAQSEALATVADYLPIDQAAPLYKKAEEESVDRNGWLINSPASVAAHAYLRDVQLGTQLFAEAFDKVITSAQSDPQPQQPSMAEFAFYYARLDPGFSRVLLEGQFLRDISNPPQYENPGTSAIDDIAAMASLDPQRALELASLIKDPDQRFNAELKISGYLVLSQSQRNTLPFQDWAQEYSGYRVGEAEPW